MILFYSGTGNSRFAASVIARETGDELVSMNEIMRRRAVNAPDARYEFSSERPFVFVCPTYCWRVPRVVEEFIRRSRFSGCQDVYFFLTCGSSTAAASHKAEQLCRELGLNFMGLGSAVMPENYIAMFDSPGLDKAEEIIRAAVPCVEASARSIREGRHIDDPNGGTGLKALPTSINSAFYKFSVNDRKFRVKETCIGCGQCETVCPLVNITLESSHPVWHGNCTQCMGCISVCPVDAIEWGRASEKRRRYYLKIDGTQKQPR